MRSLGRLVAAARAAAWIPAAVVVASALLGGALLGDQAAMAQGDRPAGVAPPDGWQSIDALGQQVATTLSQSSIFGEVRASAAAEAYANPGVGALYVAWMEPAEPVANPEQTLRTALDFVRHSRLVSSPQASSTEELRYDETLTDNVIDARLEWSHLSNETLFLVRSIGWVDRAGGPHFIRLECVATTTDGKAPDEVTTACNRALDSVAADTSASDRRPLAALPASQPVPADAADQAATATGAQASQDGGASAGSVTPPPADPKQILYQGPPPEPKSSFAKWIIIAGALLLVVAVVFTQRGRRRDA